MIRRLMDRISFGCLVLLVVVPAWIFGGVQAHVQCGMILAAIVGVAFAVIGLVSNEEGEREGAIPWLAYAVIAAIAFGAFQLVLLNSSVIGSLSPKAAEWWQNWGGVGADASVPISVYPAGTRRDMSTLTLVLLALVLASLTVNSSFRRLALCMILAANGAVMAFFGMVHQLTAEAGRFTGPFR